MPEFFYREDEETYERVFGDHRTCEDCKTSGIRTLTIKDDHGEWIEVCEPCFQKRRQKDAAA